MLLTITNDLEEIITWKTDDAIDVMHAIENIAHRIDPTFSYHYSLVKVNNKPATELQEAWWVAHAGDMRTAEAIFHLNDDDWTVNGYVWDKARESRPRLLPW